MNTAAPATVTGKGPSPLAVCWEGKVPWIFGQEPETQNRKPGDLPTSKQRTGRGVLVSARLTYADLYKWFPAYPQQRESE